MEQHPVPQQISSYEFRLVGDMTLKQFGQVAAGFVIAVLFYAAPLPFFLKWPAIILSSFLGIAFAFLPYEERPLQTWIIAFLKAAYSPTQFLWQKGGQKLAFFEERPLTKTTAQLAPVTVSKESAKRLENYLSIFSVDRVITEYEEQAFFEHIKNLFTSLPQIGQPRQTVYGEPLVARRSAPKEEKPSIAPAPQVRLEPRQFFVPPSSTAALGPRYRPPLPRYAFRREKQQTEAARFITPQIPLPSVPTVPNVLVGMLIDQVGKMVEGAIIEIRDSQGSPVRAFKTNKLGQFRIVTPLPDDTYEIEVEKEGLKFDIIKVALKGEIVKPIEMRAK